MNPQLSSNIDEISATLHALFEVGQVVELRVISPPKYGSKPFVKSGSFNDFDALAFAAASSSDNGANGVYITPNKINPALFSRSPNKLSNGLASTTDDDVIEHTYLLIDVDRLRSIGSLLRQAITCLQHDRI